MANTEPAEAINSATAIVRPDWTRPCAPSKKRTGKIILMAKIPLIEGYPGARIKVNGRQAWKRADSPPEENSYGGGRSRVCIPNGACAFFRVD